MESGNLRRLIVGLDGAVGMLGVVLWSDQKDRKAVIWCEDHGDLAFCHETIDDQGGILDTGDLIQFDVTLDRDMRLAQNPRKVLEGAYQGLADTLRTMPEDGPVAVAGERGDVDGAPSTAGAHLRCHQWDDDAAVSAEVIPIAAIRARRQSIRGYMPGRAAR